MKQKDRGLEYRELIVVKMKEKRERIEILRPDC
jgi:hypothetical protein